MSESTRASTMELPGPGYESMAHFNINTDHTADLLRTMDFCSGTGHLDTIQQVKIDQHLDTIQYCTPYSTQTEYTSHLTSTPGQNIV